MADERLPITIGQGAGARVVTLELPPFTLVGATTRTGLLTTPLRDRFGIQARLEPYSVAELAIIVRRSAGILAIELAEEGAHTIARMPDRKSTRLNSSHVRISYAVFFLKKKKTNQPPSTNRPRSGHPP